MGHTQTMTITAAAGQLGMMKRRVRRWCVRLGYHRHGRDWHLDAKQVAGIRKAAQR